MQKTIKFLIIICLCIFVLLFGGLYLLEHFRLSNAYNATKELRQNYRALINSNSVLRDQFVRTLKTVDSLESDKRGLEEANKQLRNTSNQLRNTNDQLGKQLNNAKATIDELTKGSREANSIVDQLIEQNNRFRELLEKYKFQIPNSKMDSDNNDNSSVRRE